MSEPSAFECSMRETFKGHSPEVSCDLAEAAAETVSIWCLL